MSGHMGNATTTVQSLKIVELDVENNVLYVKGAVPGFNGSDLKIKPSTQEKMKIDLLTASTKKRRYYQFLKLPLVKILMSH